jgi:hypothetical protein
MRGISLVSKMVGALFLAAVYIIFWALIIGFPVMWVWNWIMPYLFQLPHINFWQSWGILFLSASLFKSNTFTQKPKETAKDKDKCQPPMKVVD